jgi:hypothetical protein
MITPEATQQFMEGEPRGKYGSYPTTSQGPDPHDFYSVGPPKARL